MFYDWAIRSGQRNDVDFDDDDDDDDDVDDDDDDDVVTPTSDFNFDLLTKLFLRVLVSRMKVWSKYTD